MRLSLVTDGERWAVKKEVVLRPKIIEHSLFGTRLKEAVIGVSFYYPGSTSWNGNWPTVDSILFQYCWMEKKEAEMWFARLKCGEPRGGE